MTAPTTEHGDDPRFLAGFVDGWRTGVWHGVFLGVYGAGIVAAVVVVAIQAGAL